MLLGSELLGTVRPDWTMRSLVLAGGALQVAGVALIALQVRKTQQQFRHFLEEAGGRETIAALVLSAVGLFLAAQKKLATRTRILVSWLIVWLNVRQRLRRLFRRPYTVQLATDIRATGTLTATLTGVAQGEVLPGLDRSLPVEEQVASLYEQMRVFEKRHQVQEASQATETEQLSRELNGLSSMLAEFATGGLNIQTGSVLLIVAGIAVQLVAVFV